MDGCEEVCGWMWLKVEWGRERMVGGEGRGMKRGETKQVVGGGRAREVEKKTQNCRNKKF